MIQKLMIQKLKLLFPFIILFALLGLLTQQLFYSKKNELPSMLLGESLPIFALPNLYPSGKMLRTNDLRGQAALLNVWATWCSACLLEHEMLMKIKTQYHIPIFGVDYKDNRVDAQNWLQQNGNPYTRVGIDAHGDFAIDLGVYGTPETFVISPQGKIIYRHIGVIDEKAWQEILYPLIHPYEKT